VLEQRGGRGQKAFLFGASRQVVQALVRLSKFGTGQFILIASNNTW
jgi:hypothetical protein